MSLSHDDVAIMARTVGLDLPDTDLADVCARVNALLAAVTDLETAFGATLDTHEPVPPVLPATPFGPVGPYLTLRDVRQDSDANH